MVKYLFVVGAFCWVCIYAYTRPDPQPTADCKDGAVSYSKSRSGTCSRHGGVAKWR